MRTIDGKNGRSTVQFYRIYCHMAIATTECNLFSQKMCMEFVRMMYDYAIKMSSNIRKLCVMLLLMFIICANSLENPIWQMWPIWMSENNKRIKWYKK